MGVNIELECIQPGFDTVFGCGGIGLDFNFWRGRDQPHFAQYRQKYLLCITALVAQCINIQPQAAECVRYQTEVGLIDWAGGVAELRDGGAHGLQHLAGVV